MFKNTYDVNICYPFFLLVRARADFILFYFENSFNYIWKWTKKIQLNLYKRIFKNKTKIQPETVKNKETKYNTIGIYRLGKKNYNQWYLHCHFVCAKLFIFILDPPSLICTVGEPVLIILSEDLLL